LCQTIFDLTEIQSEPIMDVGMTQDASNSNFFQNLMGVGDSTWPNVAAAQEVQD
jgi:hypothetical protein